jgi:hypothetical protein
MNNQTFGWKNLILCFAGLCLAAGMLMAQPQRPQGPPERDPLGMLKHALTDASAPALSTQQEQQLTQLIAAFRDNRPDGPNETLEAAHHLYDNAIAAGNLAAANAQAAIIAQQIGADASAHLQAEAKFKIDALNVLKSNANQISALTQQFGTAGLSHLLNSLLGPGKPGGPAGHGGPGGPGRPDGPPPNGAGRAPGDRP